ncbi:hypothetical protein QNO07_04725 [Streptomyces sp. 549]|uniref:hypothetical protein n=1 Tax=Streptomyces sp. 549 TaxID=3049076 RepID=UPI0024C2C189|nr:hypothetical protein [Streptomyces sp. 549]MDK1472737.1 hypothetical protein [Streptomyces sp. 549]
MIAARSAGEAALAADQLRAALTAAGIRVTGTGVDPLVWDSLADGPIRLVELGSAHPSDVHRLAAIILAGAGT